MSAADDGARLSSCYQLESDTVPRSFKKPRKNVIRDALRKLKTNRLFMFVALHSRIPLFVAMHDKGMHALSHALSHPHAH